MRLLRRGLGLSMVLTVLLGAWLVQPAGATNGYPNYDTVTNEWASGSFTVVRYGWTVTVWVTITDRKAGNCVYAKADLHVDNGIDPDKHFADNCNGNGSSIRDSVTLRPGFSGTGFSSIKLDVCESNSFFDDCTNHTVTVYQNNARYSGDVPTLDNYMKTSMAHFQDLKRSQPGPFNWNDNGCSSPVGDAPGGFNFQNSCERHDFGYRNYGQGRTASPTDNRRAWIDDNFRNDMQNWCDAHTSGDARSDCYGWATTYYSAVRLKGGPSFFGN